MLRERRRFTDEFKKAAVDRVREGKRVADVAREVGIARSALYYWVQESDGQKVVRTAKKAKDSEQTGGGKRQYSEEFKRAVAQQVKAGRSVGAVAKASAIGSDLLYKWVHKYFPELRKPRKEIGIDDLGQIEARLEEMESGRADAVRGHVEQIDTTLTQEETEEERRESAKRQAEAEEEDRVRELVEYAKILYERQEPALKRLYPLKRKKKADAELEFEHGSRMVAIPGGGDHIRSYHPWALLQDEAAFMPEAGEAYDNAVPVCQKIVVVSSAGPGWFAEQCQSATDVYKRDLPKGVTLRRMDDCRAVYRVHYSADPERGAAWVEQERRKYSTQGAWDREQEIIHEAGGGERLFAEVLNRWGDKIIIDSPQFQPSPYWKYIGGFDHGKANPTAALVGCVDGDGNIYLLAEYYQPGMSPKQHAMQLQRLQGFMQAEVVADPSMFYKSHSQGDGSFKAISELYAEEGIANLYPSPENNELLGMERIQAHWLNLDRRQPTLRIVCPRHKRDIQRPIYGLHNDGCPNLLWELRRARRQELTAAQLVTRNPTEKIVDKDNHLRDALKYLVLSMPEPATGTIQEQLQKLTGGLDMTSFMAHYGHMLPSVFREEEKPVTLGRRGVFVHRMRYRR